jgi:hypothetical protein
VQGPDTRQVQERSVLQDREGDHAEGW